MPITKLTDSDDKIIRVGLAGLVLWFQVQLIFSQVFPMLDRYM